MPVQAMRTPRRAALATIGAASLASAAAAREAASTTFTALTSPMPLYPGQVTNAWHRLALPRGPLAISAFEADVVERSDDGTVKAVPLADAYLHHHVVVSNHTSYEHMRGRRSPMKPEDANRGVGFGAGTESRGTKQEFPYPFRFTTVDGEDELLANVHILNTRSMTVREAHRCLECPCTSEDGATTGGGPADGTAPFEAVLERKGNAGRCNADLVAEDNPSCSAEHYVGGLFCCEHGEYCLDEYLDVHHEHGEHQSTYYLRYTITYEPLTPEVKPLYLAACCDASGNLTSPGNVEYDIPQCEEQGGECTHVLETVQTLHGPAAGVFGLGGASRDGDAEVEVVYMVGHLHRAGISLTSYFENGTELCESLPTYGSGMPGEIGNEPGYINAMSSCTFDPPLRMRTTDRIRVVGKYDATEGHTGVMSLFYVAVHAPSDGLRLLPLSEEDASEPRLPGVFRRVGTHLQVLLALSMGAVVAAAWNAARRWVRRREYERIPASGIEIEV